MMLVYVLLQESLGTFGLPQAVLCFAAQGREIRLRQGAGSFLHLFYDADIACDRVAILLQESILRGAGHTGTDNLKRGTSLRQVQSADKGQGLAFPRGNKLLCSSSMETTM